MSGALAAHADAALSSIDSEHTLLGAAMLGVASCQEIFERLRPEHFGDPVHARIWAAALKCVRSGTFADPITIHREMANDPGVAEYGGLRFLVELADHATTWALPAHADAVQDASTRRHLHTLCREIADRAGNAMDEPAEALLSQLERGASEIARDGSTKPLAAPAGLNALDMLEAAWRGDYTGAPVGIATLDHVTGGIRQDDVWFIGGRTSMGKSVAALNLARGLAEQGRGVMMFSLEMPIREVQARLIADIAYDPERRYDAYFENVRYGDLLKGRGSPEQKDRARFAARKLAALPIVVSDVGGLTIEDIRNQAQRQLRAWEKAGVQSGAILIDHIGLVKAHTQRGDSKAAETADVVNELKAIAKQLRAPIIALCQVNRNTENRNDKRPTLADLNWSGAIEQIADFICLLYRDAYYLERSADADDQARATAVENEMELLIHKNRSGPICNLKVFADVACNVVRDLPGDRR
jgi:replicative DNA helicase